MHAVYSRPAFDKALLSIRPALLRYAIRRAGRETAEDLVQDALLRAWAIHDRFNADSGQSAFAVWLYRILTHVCAEWARRQSLHPESLTPSDLLLAASEEVAPLDAEIALCLRQRLYALRRTTDLTPKQQICLDRWLAEETQAEIAQSLGISQIAVQGHLRAAANRMRRREEVEVSPRMEALFALARQVARYRRPQRVGAALARERLRRLR